MLFLQDLRDNMHLKWLPYYGVDMNKKISKKLTCVFVDHGLLRKNEGDVVENIFGPNGNFDLNFQEQ